MKEWRQVDETKLVYDGWRKVFRKTMLMNDGQEFIAEVSDKEGFAAAAVIALTPDHKVIIARQFRVGPGKIMEELPGGAVDHDENPSDAAARELLEETGYRVGSIKPLGIIYKHAWMHTAWHFYLAENCTPDPQGPQLEFGEEVEVELISIEQLIANAKSGLMTDMEAVFLAYDTLKELEKNT